MHRKILTLYWLIQRGQPILINTKELRQKFLGINKKGPVQSKLKNTIKQPKKKYIIPTKN